MLLLKDRIRENINTWTLESERFKHNYETLLRYKPGLNVFDVRSYTVQVYYTIEQTLLEIFFFFCKENVHILLFQPVIVILGKGIVIFYQQKCIFILRLPEKKKTSLLMLTHYYYELWHLHARMKMSEEKLVESWPPTSHSEKIARARHQWGRFPHN